MKKTPIIAALSGALLIGAAAFAASTKTVEDLNTAYRGETTAHATYAAYARDASAAHYPAIARLFRAASLAEYIHANNHKAVLKSLGVTPPTPGLYHRRPHKPGTSAKDIVKADLKAAAAGENYETDEMYPTMIKDADNEGIRAAARSFTYARNAEAQHAALYTVALKNMDQPQIVPFYSVCDRCGATWAGSGPPTCPVCGEKQSKFYHVR